MTSPAGGATSDQGIRLLASNPTVLFARFLGAAVERTESTTPTSSNTLRLAQAAAAVRRSRQLLRLRGREKTQVQA